jgi:hypothetical protein
MNVRYRVDLSQAEHDRLTALLGGGKHAARKLKRAQILLAADAGVGDGNRVDQLADRHRSFDAVEEADELLTTVPLHATAEHAAVQRVPQRSGLSGGRGWVRSSAWI